MKLMMETELVPKLWSVTLMMETEQVSKHWLVTLMMETELLPETLAYDCTLTQLIAWEDFMTFTGRKIFKFYVVNYGFLFLWTEYLNIIWTNFGIKGLIEFGEYVLAGGKIREHCIGLEQNLLSIMALRLALLI
jgi:hypothetical protein